MANRTAIIGGTGLESLPPKYQIEKLEVHTAFGDASLSRVLSDRGETLFLSRHGSAHHLAPHEINYQANIAALVQLGVKSVLAANAVGSLRLDLPPGSLVLFDDFIDFTRARPLSYWQDHPEAPEGVVHTDFSNPYCSTLRNLLEETSVEQNFDLLSRGTYLCADGPRFESPAEIRMFAQWGGDVVGMTGLPEAIFAREAGLCYAGIGIVTNFGAGLTRMSVDHADVLKQMAGSVATVRHLLIAAAANVPTEYDCTCNGK